MLAINDSHPFPYYVFGHMHRIEENYAKAANFYNQVVVNSPDNTGYKFDTAITLAKIGLLEYAGRVFE